MVEELKAERYQEVGRCYTLHESHTSVHLIRLSAFRVGENGEYMPTVSGTVVCHIFRNWHIEDDKRRWGLPKSPPHHGSHMDHSYAALIYSRAFQSTDDSFRDRRLLTRNTSKRRWGFPPIILIVSD